MDTQKTFNIGFELEVVTELEKTELRALLKKHMPLWHNEVKIVRDYTFSGWELVTKPYAQTEALDKLGVLLNFIKTESSLSTDKTTALHVNISHVDDMVTSSVKLDALYNNLDIHSILKKYKRVNNNYTRSPRKYMFYTYIDFNNLSEVTSFLNDKDVQAERLSQLRKKFEEEIAMNRKNVPIARKKYKGLTYFEFRMIGGQDYHKKLRSIKNDVHKMCDALSASFGE